MHLHAHCPVWSLIVVELIQTQIPRTALQGFEAMTVYALTELTHNAFVEQ